MLATAGVVTALEGLLSEESYFRQAGLETVCRRDAASLRTPFSMNVASNPGDPFKMVKTQALLLQSGFSSWDRERRFVSLQNQIGPRMAATGQLGYLCPSLICGHNCP